MWRNWPCKPVGRFQFSLRQLGIVVAVLCALMCATCSRDVVEERFNGNLISRADVLRFPCDIVLYHGRYERWYCDGARMIAGSYLLGTRAGVWTYYDESGRAVAEVMLWPND